MTRLTELVVLLIVPLAFQLYAPDASAELQEIDHECLSCDPDIMDEALLEIKSILNADHTVLEWREGDIVTITNPRTGDSATYLYTRYGTWVMISSSEGSGTSDGGGDGGDSGGGGSSGGGGGEGSGGGGEGGGFFDPDPGTGGSGNYCGPTTDYECVYQ